MILDAFRLGGRVALVTGAARGLGQGMALGLAEAGADLLLADLLPCDETAALISGLGRRCGQVAVDMRQLDAAGAAALVAEAVGTLGRLDILVNNAGIIRRSPALNMEADDWQAVLDTNLSSGFYLAQAAARQFVEAARGGKIVNVASMLSFQGGLLVASYAAAKSGVAGLTRALANEWAPLGINVNAVAPGYFATAVTAGIRADEGRNRSVLERIPAGRWGEPADLKGTVVFLASDAAAYLHGVVLPVDGGWLSR